jgi:hypothetical protein
MSMDVELVSLCKALTCLNIPLRHMMRRPRKSVKNLRECSTLRLSKTYHY